jgi:membrane-associated HD superfamily phosphohydrolase
MYEIIQKSHSGFAYLAFLVLVIAVVNSFIGLFSKKDFTGRDRKISLFAFVAIHTQLLIGFLVYFVSPKGFPVIGNVGMGEVMKNAALRLTVVEHPLINIIGIILITIGWVKHKKLTTSESKFKTFSIYYGLGLVLILSRIPWGLWLNK